MKPKSLKNPVFAHVTELAALKQLAETILSVKQKKQAFKDIGNQKSPFKSKGLDFQEVRVYQPGDDLRQIDWRVTARYGKPFTKLYTDEKARSVFLFADLRTSMKFASAGDFKSVVCAKCTALLTFMALHHQDKINVQILLPDKILFFSHIKNYLGHLLNALSDATFPQDLPQDTLTLKQGLDTAVEQIPKNSEVYILSDFHDLDPEYESVIGALAHKNTLLFIHIYDFLEQQLPSGYLPITNGRESLVLDTTSAEVRRLFHEKFDRRYQLINRLCLRYEINYLPLRNNTDYIRNLRFFCEREQHS